MQRVHSMELRNLIDQARVLRQQHAQIQAQEKQVRSQLDELESRIRSLTENLGSEYEELTEKEFQMILSEIGDVSRICIEVVYAAPGKQMVHEIQVPKGSTIEDGIQLSGILDENPEIDLARNKVGLFGAIKALTEELTDGDRIEIYRPVNS